MQKFNHVCIIDDDPIYVFTTRKLMEVSNLSKYIEIFKNGKEALDTLKPRIEVGEKVPEVILLDLNMPVMDGWEFLDAFVSPDTEKIIIYVVSSSIDPADMQKAKEYSQVSNYVVKPITPQRLKALFDEIEK
ncbi:response regulator [Bernardetia sp.]|uniref:response regulator n=1 Tax=Bernardetia sp. TaxID=1937974 RepID=UPI0025BC65F0|nr:response regulator [Bernardetia sp.]